MQYSKGLRIGLSIPCGNLIITVVDPVAINGLVGVSYVDKVLNATTHQQSDASVKIAGEVDRVYASIPQDTTSVVEDGSPRFDVVRDNLSDTVVWNPWIEKAMPHEEQAK